MEPGSAEPVLLLLLLAVVASPPLLLDSLGVTVPVELSPVGTPSPVELLSSARTCGARKAHASSSAHSSSGDSNRDSGARERMAGWLAVAEWAAGGVGSREGRASGCSPVCTCGVQLCVCEW